MAIEVPQSEEIYGGKNGGGEAVKAKQVEEE